MIQGIAIVEAGVNKCRCNGGSGFEIKCLADASKITDVIVTNASEFGNLVCERKR